MNTVGAPITTKIFSGVSDVIHVPVLIELDRPTVITLTSRNVFSGVERSWTYPVLAKRPFVFKVGPCELMSRYVVTFVAGIRNPDEATFTISTHIHMNETNVIVMNGTPVLNSPVCSEFVYDITKRNRIPYHGIAVVVHTQVQVNLKDIVGRLSSIKGFAQCLRLAGGATY